jgi:glyoxylase-like metal-dependent hydrolase (beta-lactamase superfamily II)
MSSEVAPGIWMFVPPTGGTVYVVRATAALVLIDASFFDQRDFLLARMAENGLNPRDIRLAFATHFHCDHVGGLGWWQKEFGFEVVAHEKAVQPLETADRISTAASIPAIGFSAELIACPVTHQVAASRSFAVGERMFLAYAAPGHCSGSIHIAVERVLFVGDTLFADGTIGWMDVHWGSHPEYYVETLERMRRHIGWTILPAHGSAFVLEARHIDQAQKLAAFYIPPGHGLGLPRAPSQY